MAFVEIVPPGKGSWRQSARPGERTRIGQTASPELMQELAADIAESLSKGLYLESACALAGVTTRSVHGWLRKGKNDYEADKASPEADFYEVIAWGNAKFEELMHDKLDSAAKADPKSWGATAFRLERRLPEKYGKVDKNKVELSGAMGVGIANLPDKLSDTLDSPEKIDAAKAIGGILQTLSAGGRPASVRDDSDGWQSISAESSGKTE